MTVTIPQVEASKPEGLTQTATALGQTASSLSSQIDTQRATIDGLRNQWAGPASDAAIAKAQPTLLKMQQIHDALGRTQSVLQQGGGALTLTRTNLLQTVTGLTGQGWQVGPDGTVSVRPGSPIDQFAKISESNAMKVQQLAATNSVNVKALLASFDTTDRRLSQNLRTAVGGLDGAPLNFGPGDLPEAPGYDDGSEIPVGKDAKEVNKWWNSLDPTEQKRLLAAWPNKLGNLNGIPIADRSIANNAVLQQDLNRPAEVAKSRGVTKEEVLAHPEKYGMAGPMMDRYNNALKVDAAMKQDARDAKDANRKTPDILLMKYDPEAFGGKGAAAIAIGNPDKAPNTTVMVSGLTTSVAAETLSDGSAVNVYNEANKADWNNPTAVVQWMGYDAPNDLAVAEPNMARNGAQLLAPDVNGLAATHDDAIPAHTTVIGHSYGSTTVADAAAGYGMYADDVVLVGCPGTDLATSAADLHLPPGGHLYVGSASTDIVTNFGSPHLNVPGVGLGTDPAMDGFGSTRFHAEAADFSPNPIDEHTSYFKKGSESLFSVADIVSGHGNALEHDGMTADHRVQTPGLPFPVPGLPSPLVIDPELMHSSNNDHSHSGPGG